MMMKRCGAAVVLAGAGVALGFYPNEAAAEERARETYRIYSLLLTKPRTSHGPDDNPRYLIAATARVEPFLQAPCVSPPKGREAEFADVMADFERRKGERMPLKRKLAVAKPYELLSEAEVAAFQAAADRRSERFKGVTDLFSFTGVYFSKSGRMAMTAMSSWCGGLCGQAQWRVFEKVGEEWQERPWVTCFTVA